MLQERKNCTDLQADLDPSAPVLLSRSQLNRAGSNSPRECAPPVTATSKTTSITHRVQSSKYSPFTGTSTEAISSSEDLSSSATRRMTLGIYAVSVNKVVNILPVIQNHRGMTDL